MYKITDIECFDGVTIKYVNGRKVINFEGHEVKYGSNDIALYIDGIRISFVREHTRHCASGTVTNVKAHYRTYYSGDRSSAMDLTLENLYAWEQRFEKELKRFRELEIQKQKERQKEIEKEQAKIRKLADERKKELVRQGVIEKIRYLEMRIKNLESQNIELIEENKVFIESYKKAFFKLGSLEKNKNFVEKNENIMKENIKQLQEYKKIVESTKINNSKNTMLTLETVKSNLEKLNEIVIKQNSLILEYKKGTEENKFITILVMIIMIMLQAKSAVLVFIVIGATSVFYAKSSIKKVPSDLLMGFTLLLEIMLILWALRYETSALGYIFVMLFICGMCLFFQPKKELTF